MSKFRIDTFMSHYPGKAVDTYDEIYEPIKMDDDIPLSIIEVKIDNTSKNISVPRHWHRSIEILLPESGGTQIHEDQGDRKVYSGDFALINSASVHELERADADHIYHGYAIQISYPYLCYLIENFEEITFTHEYLEEDRKKMTELLCQLIKAYDSNLANRRLIVMTALNRFLSILCNRYMIQKENTIIPNAIDLITNTMHYMSIHVFEVFNAKKTAEAMNVSYGYLSRKFKEVSGFSLGGVCDKNSYTKSRSRIIRK
ncbi:MAG: AraC family ligand binding domain-containing protein [Solobacterium sp.]|nr:AraC family ligand binding domain-containing protein [Solobacterium sp.]